MAVDYIPSCKSLTINMNTESKRVAFWPHLTRQSKHANIISLTFILQNIYRIYKDELYSTFSVFSFFAEDSTKKIVTEQKIRKIEQ